MSIDKKNLEEIRKKIDKKMKNTKCEVCGEDDWLLNDRLLILLLTDDPNVSHSGGNITPSITVTCSKCGYIRLFNLLVLGIWDEIVKKIKDSK